jgi:hypothetical protein
MGRRQLQADSRALNTSWITSGPAKYLSALLISHS